MDVHDRPKIGTALSSETFAAWLKSRPDRDRYDRYPVFMVSAEGGGIRAAYWTALVLATLQERTPDFAAHVFSISGVSGGSLGAGLFGALMSLSTVPVCNVPEMDGLPACIDAFLAQDFFTPILAALLTGDLPQRFMPWPMERLDRARALERAWTSAWDQTISGERIRSGSRLIRFGMVSLDFGYRISS